MLLSPYLDEALAQTNQELGGWLSSLRGKNPAIADLLETLLRNHRKLSEEGFLEGFRPNCLGKGNWPVK